MHTRIKVKVKVTLKQATKTQRGSRTSVFDGGGCLTALLGGFTDGKDPVPMYTRLYGPQGRSGRVRKSRPHWESIPGPSSS